MKVTILYLGESMSYDTLATPEGCDAEGGLDWSRMEHGEMTTPLYEVDNF